MEDLKNFKCQIHKTGIINAICTKPLCYKPLCCIACVLDENCMHLIHKESIMTIEDYIDYIANEYQSLKRLRFGQKDPIPKQLLDYISGEDEILNNLSKHIEEEKKSIEKALGSLLDMFIKACNIAKENAYRALDKQFNNLKANHLLYKSRLKRFYGQTYNTNGSSGGGSSSSSDGNDYSDNEVNPTKSDLIAKINEFQNASEFENFINEIQLDLVYRVPNNQELLASKIEEINYNLNAIGKAIKNQCEIRPKLEFINDQNGLAILMENLSKYVNQMLTDGFKLVYPIQRITDIIGFDSKILTTKDMMLLATWTNPCLLSRFKLLYRATRDGFSANSFHAKIESAHPTVVIIHSEYNKRFGGYAEVDWTGSSYYKDSKNAFLFSFDAKEIYPIKDETHAIYVGQTYCPIFGGGQDIFISNMSNINANSYSNFGTTYISKGKDCDDLVGGKNFKTIEIEIFQVI